MGDKLQKNTTTNINSELKNSLSEHKLIEQKIFLLKQKNHQLKKELANGIKHLETLQADDLNKNSRLSKAKKQKYIIKFGVWKKEITNQKAINFFKFMNNKKTILAWKTSCWGIVIIAFCISLGLATIWAIIKILFVAFSLGA